MAMDILKKGIRKYRDVGLKMTLSQSLQYASRKDPLGVGELYNHFRDWREMSNINYNAYLRENGWVKSMAEGLPVSKSGDPIPWYTYPAIDFLDNSLRPDVSVFEYGSGHSTIWYAERVKDVVGVEHSPEWAEIVQSQLPESGRVVMQSEKHSYINEVDNHAPVDLVVIDGEYRPDCIAPAMDALSSEGIIILDDYHLLTSDREYVYDATEYDTLLNSDFRVLPFYGPKALANRKRCTAFFYRPDNCLEI